MLKKILYIDSSAGISGDMSVAALIDLGASFNEIRRVLESLHLEGFSVSYEKVEKAGISAGSFSVILDEAHENHDHDMEYLHGHDHDEHGHRHDEHEHGYHHDEHEHGHHHDEHEHGHYHDEHERGHHHDEHEHGHHHHGEHRGLKEVFEIIESADTSEDVKALAKKIFEIVAEAEGKAHGVEPSEVHFHEVGALDSIADIIAFSVAYNELGFTDVIIPHLSEGKGTVRCRHGILPIPVPAVAQIVSAHSIPLNIMSVNGEFVTPTGAAIAAAIRTGKKLPESFVIKKTGTGAGKRSYERPSILRMMIIEEKEENVYIDENGLDIGYVYKLESNIDDSTGEALGHVMEKLFEAGAYDVHYVPVFMKKNRPGVVLYVICSEKLLSVMERIIYTNTTTIGIRRLKMQRSCLNRRLETRNTGFGEVRVKVCELYGETRVYPEYESIREICERTGRGFTDIYNALIGVI